MRECWHPGCSCRPPAKPGDDTHACAAMLAGSIVFTPLLLALTLVVVTSYWGQPDYKHMWLLPAFMTATMFALGVGAFIGLCRQQ